MKRKVVSVPSAGVKFDYWTINGDGSVWMCLCESCRKCFPALENRLDPEGSGACSVLGCDRRADYYVDFNADEVSLLSVEEVEQ